MHMLIPQSSVSITFTTLLESSADHKLVIFFLIFPGKKIWQVMQIISLGDNFIMQIISLGDNLHETSNLII